MKVNGDEDFLLLTNEQLASRARSSSRGRRCRVSSDQASNPVPVLDRRIDRYTKASVDVPDHVDVAAEVAEVGSR